MGRTVIIFQCITSFYNQNYPQLSDLSEHLSELFELSELSELDAELSGLSGILSEQFKLNISFKSELPYLSDQ